jgi:rhodanese-related sulfurtransferase
VKQFDSILKGDMRAMYQIIDVRETNELALVAIPGTDVIHLPLR